MYILSLGGWYVGNSAILEWLSRYKEVKFLKGDLHEFRNDTGIYDLVRGGNRQYKLIFKIILRHTRWLVKSLLNEIKKKLSLKFDKNHSFSIEYNLKIILVVLRFLFSFEKGYNESISFWSEYFNNDFFPKSDYIVLQNPSYYDDISPNNKEIWRAIFGEFKIIFVTRDPIEQFIDCYLNKELVFKDTKFRSGTECFNELDTFLYIAKRTYLSRIEMLNEFGPDVLSIISFESFAYLDSNSEVKIEDYFGLSKNENLDKFDFNYTQSNTILREVHPDLAAKIECRKSDLDELYTLKRILDNSCCRLV